MTEAESVISVREDEKNDEASPPVRGFSAPRTVLWGRTALLSARACSGLAPCAAARRTVIVGAPIHVGRSAEAKRTRSIFLSEHTKESERWWARAQGRESESAPGLCATMDLGRR